MPTPVRRRGSSPMLQPAKPPPRAEPTLSLPRCPFGRSFAPSDHSRIVRLRNRAVRYGPARPPCPVLSTIDPGLASGFHPPDRGSSTLVRLPRLGLVLSRRFTNSSSHSVHQPRDRNDVHDNAGGTLAPVARAARAGAFGQGDVEARRSGGRAYSSMSVGYVRGVTGDQPSRSGGIVSCPYRRARRSTRGARVCSARRGVRGRRAAGRHPRCRMRSCWRPFALTWPAHRSRVRAIARSTRGCGSSTTSGSPGRGCCG